MFGLRMTIQHFEHNAIKYFHLKIKKHDLKNITIQLLGTKLYTEYSFDIGTHRPNKRRKQQQQK